MGSRLVVIDTSNFIFRAFYAIRPLSSPDGRPVNAVYGVLNMILKLLSDYQATHLVLAQDTGRKTFRLDLYDQYKANRGETPEDLVPQFEIINELIDRLGLVRIGIQNYEADDVIGTIVTKWKSNFDEVFIASGDKDLMQFVGGNVKIIDTMKSKVFGPDEVYEKMGVRPNQIVDYLSMVGDSSDNIPGMKGIGAKGAAKLLAEFETLEKCIEESDKFTAKRLKNAFENYIDDAILSKKLVNIVTDLELDVTPEKCSYKFSPDSKLITFLENLGMKSMVKKIKELSYMDAKLEEEEGHSEDHILDEAIALAPKSLYPICLTPIINKVTNSNFDQMLVSLKNTKSLATYLTYKENEMVSISICFNTNEIYLLNFIDEESDGLFVSSEFTISEINRDRILERLWTKSSSEIISSDIKTDMVYALDHNISFAASFFDTTQAHYIIDPAKKHSFDHYSTLNGEKGEESAFIFAFSLILKDQLSELKLEHIFNEIDGPMCSVLARMESVGVMINVPYFKELEIKFAEDLQKINKQVLKEANIDEINLKSPKQVGELLFGKLGLPVIKKKKNGPSTDSSVLEELVSLDMSEIPQMILESRELEKLQSSYVKTIPTLIQNDGRIHTKFNQHVAVTGRLSSEQPNLQNIPVRTVKGKMLRKGFVARPGMLFLSADYSQVELRILANMSQDKVMVDAFKSGDDIHLRTASEVLKVPVDQVTKEQRSIAKAVNFGLMYGQTSFGLSQTLKIPLNEAREYIKNYFEKFRGVRVFLDELKERAEDQGYVETEFGRKRFIPEIRSTNRVIKGHAERAAVNGPIQGTAADMIKLSMIEIQREILKRKLKSAMLLQVHDELIFEVPEKEVNELKDLVIDSMENISQREVPYKVNVSIGVNWFDLK